MKKIILIFIICLLVSGCGKENKNITINIYENSDKEEVIEEKVSNDSKESEEKKQNTNIEQIVLVQVIRVIQVIQTIRVIHVI